MSYLSDFKQCHIGCIAVYKNHIVSIGFNTNKTHPLQKKYNKYRDLDYNGYEPEHKLHAEMMCLLGLKDMEINFSKVKLYIYREDKNGNIANCRPCDACMELIDRLGIKRIYYTTEKGYVKEIRRNNGNKNTENEVDMSYRYNTLF